jgi:hypothetical protein
MVYTVAGAAVILQRQTEHQIHVCFASQLVDDFACLVLPLDTHENEELASDLLPKLLHNGADRNEPALAAAMMQLVVVVRVVENFVLVVVVVVAAVSDVVVVLVAVASGDVLDVLRMNATDRGSLFNTAQARPCDLLQLLVDLFCATCQIGRCR